VPACLGTGLFNTFPLRRGPWPHHRSPPPGWARHGAAWASPEGRGEGHHGRPTSVPISPAERLTAVRQGGTVLIPADDTSGRPGKSALKYLYVEVCVPTRLAATT
jgi:hypothetical protein